MAEHTYRTVRTRYVEANGIRFAYRRFGKVGAVPLVFNMHFTRQHGAQGAGRMAM